MMKHLRFTNFKDTDRTSMYALVYVQQTMVLLVSLLRATQIIHACKHG